MSGLYGFAGTHGHAGSSGSMGNFGGMAGTEGAGLAETADAVSRMQTPGKGPGSLDSLNSLDAYHHHRGSAGLHIQGPGWMAGLRYEPSKRDGFAAACNGGALQWYAGAHASNYQGYHPSRFGQAPHSRFSRAPHSRFGQAYFPEVDPAIPRQGRFLAGAAESDNIVSIHAGQSCLILAGLLYCDTSPAILLQRLCDEDPPTVVRSLNGSFVLFFADAKRNRIWLFRDHAGEKTIYHARMGRSLVFASDPLSIIRFPGFSRRLRYQGIAEYLTFSFLPGQDTMLQDLFELEAGSYLTADAGNPGDFRIRRYFQFEHLEGSQSTDAYRRNEAGVPDNSQVPHGSGARSHVMEFRKLLEECVSSRWQQCHSQPGLFLSGGLDSSAVAAILQNQIDEPLNSFSLHFGKRYPNELEYARQVAHHIGCRHHEIEISPRRFLPRLSEMIRHLGEPIGDPVTIGNFELSRVVGNHVNTIFNGEGGDPCFGGPKNLPMAIHHYYGGQTDYGSRFRARKYLASYQRCYSELPGLLSANAASQISLESLEDRLIPFFDQNNSFLRKLLSINIRLKGAHLILPKVERLTASAGLTAMAPLFDRRMIERSFELPGNMILRHGVEKLILKQSMHGMLPESVIHRPKSGMRVPVYFWFQGQMKSYAKKVLSPPEIRKAGLFNPDRIQQLLRYDIEEGAGRFGIRLWMLLTFEIWRRMVFENEIP